jgi:hypothetical protein
MVYVDGVCCSWMMCRLGKLPVWGKLSCRRRVEASSKSFEPHRR